MDYGNFQKKLKFNYFIFLLNRYLVFYTKIIKKYAFVNTANAINAFKLLKAILIESSLEYFLIPKEPNIRGIRERVEITIKLIFDSNITV